MAELTQEKRRAILARGFLLVAIYIAGYCAVLFGSAGSFDWPEAWIFIALFVIYFTIWVTWGLRHDPDLLIERSQSLSGKAKPWDMKLVRINLLVSIVAYIVAGLDAVRFGWSSVNTSLKIVGFILFIFGYILPFYALSNNPFASGTVRIQTERGHRVASGGPYRFVRHPMYVGAIVAAFGVPLFLGSYWALIPGAVMALIFIYRTAREDQTLQDELKGYKEYAQKVRFRLLPGIW